MYQNMLKFKFKDKPYCNDLHFFLFSVVLTLLTIHSIWFGILLILYFIFLLRRTKYIIPILVIIGTVSFSFYISKRALKEQSPGIYKGIYEIIDVTENTMILKGESKMIIYTSVSDLKPGDIIYAEIKVTCFSKPSFNGDFNRKSYYNSKGITNYGKLIHYEKQGAKFRIERSRYFVLNFYKEHLGEKSYAYVKALLFGVSEFDEEITNAYSSLYLSHFLAISGLHIHFFYSILLCFFRKMFRISGEKISLCILGGYVLFIGYPMATLRAFLFLLLRLLNQRGSIKYTELDIFSISYIGMVILFPLKAFQVGFILSYIVSFILLFMEEYSRGCSKWKKRFCSSGLCILSILPFLIQQTNQIFLLGILFSFFLGAFLGKIILPLILGVFLVPNHFIEFLFTGLDQGLLLLCQYSLPIPMPTLSLFGVVLYYVLFIIGLIFLAKNKKRYILFLPLYFVLIFSLRLINSNYRVTYIDVGQGDSILIELPFNRGNVLIDTYTKTGKYLRSLGIKKLNFVILTHFDQDHCATLSEICQNFQVEHILYPIYEEDKKLPEYNGKLTGIKSGDSISVAELKMSVLGPIYDYKNSNANSIVLRMKIKEFFFLFTGDLTSNAEFDLVKKYGKELSSDVLKVGHHGSKTSSSKEFLQAVSPSISIISVGINNSYDLPDEEVIRRLEKYSKVYMTMNMGNIKIVVGRNIKVYPYRK